MPVWNSGTPPVYTPPSTTTPNWIWSIVGTGTNSFNTDGALIIRLDYVMLDSSGNFVRVPNFTAAWVSGTRYIPIYMHLTEGTGGSYGGQRVAGYDYWASQGANAFWQGYIWKFLRGMKATQGSVLGNFPLVGT